RGGLEVVVGGEGRGHAAGAGDGPQVRGVDEDDAVSVDVGLAEKTALFQRERAAGERARREECHSGDAKAWAEHCGESSWKRFLTGARQFGVMPGPGQGVALPVNEGWADEPDHGYGAPGREVAGILVLGSGHGAIADAHAQSAGPEHQPLPPPARPQPGGLV